MKTFKIFYASFAFIFLGLVPISAMGQSMPHTFSANNPAVASEVNANFKYLLDRFGGIRETTVNCGTNGSGINSAIQNGYNSIVINGICKENIILDGTKGDTPRLLKLRGANNDASVDKIIDNSSYADDVITAWYSGMLLSIDNLTISGGERGISTWSNINLKIYNSKVEGYKKRGVNLQGGSVMDADNLTIDGSYSSASSSETGLEMWGNSIAFANNLTITNNQKYGITTYVSLIELQGNIALINNARAINVGHSSTLSTGSNMIISGSTSDGAISVNQGLLNVYEGSINVANSPHVLNAWMSNVHIKNFTAIGDGSTSKNIIDFSNSVGTLENVTLSNGGASGIGLHNSDVEIDNLTSSNNKERGIGAYRSRVDMRNSAISSNEDDGIDLDQRSVLTLRSSTISSNLDEGIEVGGGSFVKIRDSSTISGNSDNAIKVAEGSILDIKDSTISAVSGKQAIQGYNNAILIVDEDSGGTTLISTTNADAIHLNRNSHGEIRDGVVVSGTGSSNWPSGIELYGGSSIRIEDGATVTGTQDFGSVVGSLRSTIDIEHGSTITGPVYCGSDGTTIVILDNSSGNYQDPTAGGFCMKIINQ